jgi:hypothetical protein
LEEVGTMARVVFTGPTGTSIDNPDLDYLRNLVLSPPPGYWSQGNGGATFEYGAEQCRKQLLYLPNPRHGIYLKYCDEGDNEWLSLQDPTKLEEVAECSDQWYASVGLFLPPEKAWEAVAEFCRTGRRTDRISWIDPGELPEGGNW